MDTWRVFCDLGFPEPGGRRLGAVLRPSLGPLGPFFFLILWRRLGALLARLEAISGRLGVILRTIRVYRMMRLTGIYVGMTARMIVLVLRPFRLTYEDRVTHDLTTEPEVWVRWVLMR